MELKYYTRRIPDSLLAKYAVNETTSAESSRVEEWIAADEKNRRYVEGLFKIIEKCGQMQKATPENEQAAWEGFWQSKKYSKPASTPIRWLYDNVRWVSVAAILVLLVGTAVILYSVNSHTVQPSAVMKEIHGDGIRTDTLPDGSFVLLNKRSRLFYPYSFEGSQRNVELEGTCFFSVAHDTDKPFRIKVKDLLVTVVGTSFTIRDETGKTEIQVRTGIVEVTKRNHSLRLFQGDKLIVLTTDTTLVKAASDTSQPTKKLSVSRKSPVKESAIIAPGELEKQKKIVRNIIADIINQRIVSKQDSIEWFGLTDKEFIINGAKQPKTTHQLFRNKYSVKPEFGYYFGPVEMVGKGAFITKEDLNQ